MSAAGTQAAILAAEGKMNEVSTPPIPLSGELVKLDYKSRVDDATFLAECQAAMDANGVVCILHAITDDEADAITTEMQPYIDATPNHQIFPSETKLLLTAIAVPSQQLIKDRWFFWAR